MTTEHLPLPAASIEQAFAMLLIRLGDRQFGLPLESVERIMPMAHVLSLPDSGNGLLGMLNIHGQVMPVIDPHPRLGLLSPTMAAEQRLVLLRASEPFLLWVDDVEEVIVSDPDALSVVPVQEGNPLVARVLRLGESIVPILAPAELAPHGTLR